MSAQKAPAYLLDGIRTPFGKYDGALSHINSTDLGVAVVSEVLKRNPWAKTPDAALMGVVVQAGLGQNPARIAALRGGAATTTPALTLNSVCLASLEAVCDATRRIQYGEGSHYIVGGFDSMSRSAWMLPRAQLRAAAAAANVIQKEEMLAVVTPDGLVHADQGIRPQSSLAALALLKPAFSEAGTITAGNASQRADGGSAGLVVNAAMLDRAGKAPLAKIIDWGWVAGPDPSLHFKPAMAIRQVLEKQGLKPSDIDLYEINEAFASVAIASANDLGLSEDIVNVNGGAIALGHPLGATGFRLLLTLALELRRCGLRRGIASLCGGGGQGLAVLIENAV